MIEEQALDPLKHDRTGFSCGVAELDDYLHRFAAQQSKKGVTVVRALLDTAAPQTILGYYTLSAAQVDCTALSDADRQKLPRYPVPCFRMGRLATSAAHRGEGMGKVLIGCAVERCLMAKEQVAAFALIVDAKGEEAKRFYQHYGFAACADSAMTLYLPLGSVAV